MPRMSEAYVWFLAAYAIFGTNGHPIIHAKIILGIDPGLRRTGFGVISQVGNRLGYIASGVIKTDADEDLAARLGVIFENVSQVVKEYQPTSSAIEKVFVNVNPQSTLLLGQARGAAIVAMKIGGLNVSEYTALQLKKAVVGYGHATKEQIQLMIQQLLKLPGLPGADAADALACAICHAHSRA
jgi:crossover junction endodeoxyribonuclease RuvC